jgi:hypothetical protein
VGEGRAGGPARATQQRDRGSDDTRHVGAAFRGVAIDWGEFQFGMVVMVAWQCGCAYC